MTGMDNDGLPKWSEFADTTLDRRRAPLDLTAVSDDLRGSDETDLLQSRRFEALDPFRADTFRFSLAGRLVIGMLIWLFPGWILWTMILHPGTVFFVWSFAMSPALIALAAYISVSVWRKPN